MDLIVILSILAVLAVLAPRWGADTHRSDEWGTPHDPPRTPDRPRHTGPGPVTRLRPRH